MLVSGYHLTPKAKKPHFYPFMADVTWLKWPKDLCRGKTEGIDRCKREEKMGKNVDMLNLTRNFRLCSDHVNKEKIGANGYMSGDPVYFA